MKRISRLLGITQIVIAISAIPAGISMIIDPSGVGVGMSTEMLSGSPFTDYLIPGIFLLVVNGLLNAAGAVMSFRLHPKAGLVGLLLGIFLVLWIAIQVYMIGLSHFLQPLFFVIGLVEWLLSHRLNQIKN